MKRLLSFVSPWALVVVLVWLVVMVLAYNWAVPIYANIGGPGLCGVPGPCSQDVTFTVTQPDTTIFAIIVATGVAALFVGSVLGARRLGQR